MDNNKKLLYVVGAVVVLAGVLWLVQKSSNTSMTSSPTPTVSGAGTTTGGTAGKPGQAMPDSYVTALAKYEGKRIQFDINCQAIPVSLSYKNGVSLMLDNRSGDARVIKIGATSYSLAGYGWKIVTLTAPASQLPATLNINCGSAVNVSKVLLQK